MVISTPEQELGAPYQLISTGELSRIERFGDVVLERPSSLAIWEPNFSLLKKISNNTNLYYAKFEPKQGWKILDSKRKLDSWNIDLCANSKNKNLKLNFKLKLRLQNNGQIGFFPEHLNYQDIIIDHLLSIKDQEPTVTPKVLNLYAFTGMSSIVCSLLDADVTHVDILQTANNWAKENYELNLNNTPPLKPIRFITEDTIKYCQRAINRGEKYDLIITDPPSFSRTGKNSSWNLEENLVDQIQMYKRLLSDNGLLIFTSHLHEFGNLVIENIFRDIFGEDTIIESEQLFVREVGRERKLPCGWKVKKHGTPSFTRHVGQPQK